MKRLLAISDIHGNSRELFKLLNKARFNRHSDKLILLGDYIDRGSESLQTLREVMALTKAGHIAIKGNHEEMLLNIIDNFLIPKLGDKEELLEIITKNSILKSNGQDKTLLSMIDLDKDSINEIRDFIMSLPSMITIDNFVFVHGGINPLKSLLQQSSDDVLWSRNLIQSEINISELFGKTFIYGHTPTKFNNFKIYRNINGFGIDCGAGYNKRLGCLSITDKSEFEEFYVDMGDFNDSSRI